MNIASLNKVGNYKLLLLILPLCYLLLPNNNQTLDSWGYASYVKYGEGLFQAHHLIYNWFMYHLKLFPGLNNSLDTMKFMQFINGLFSIFSLLFLYLTLLNTNNCKNKSLSWTILVGCTFSLLRYGTENETYILPIFFSIIASYFLSLYFKQTSELKWLFFSGLAAAISCLFHQIHFFWWLAILLGLFIFSTENRIKKSILFLLPAIVVPVTYGLVIRYSLEKELELNNILSYVFEYYYSENADTEFGAINLIMTPISFFRTFYQVHGNIINLILAKPVLSACSFTLSSYFFYKFLFPLKLRSKFNTNNLFTNIHLLAFLLQFGFAFYSHGNAEFMVMLPFLMAIFLSDMFTISNNKLISLALSMLIWNLSFAIFPNHFYNYHNNQEIIKVINAYPDKKFILEERQKINLQYRYEYDEDISERIFFKMDIVNKKETGVFYTDILTKKTPFNRGSITLNNNTNLNYTVIRSVENIQSFYGNYSVDEIMIK